MSIFSGGSFFRSIPPVTKNLLIINIIVWIAMLILPSRLDVDIMAFGALHYFKAPHFNPAQLLTYMFMHDTSGIWHLLFNMLMLWMFGSTIERVLGSPRYLFYYLSVGIGAALLQELVWSFTWTDSFLSALARSNPYLSLGDLKAAWEAGQIPPTLSNQYLDMLMTVGASGAIYGLLLAFGMIFPNRPLYLMFIPVPIKAKWMVIAYGVIDLLLGISGADGVAHFAHLGGMLFGLLLIWYWKKKGTIYTDFY